MGKGNADKNTFSLGLKAFDITDDQITFTFMVSKKLGVKSGVVAAEIRRLAISSEWGEQNAPLVCILSDQQYKDVYTKAMRKTKLDTLMQNKDYKGACMLFAPLKEIRNNADVWGDADILYMLGLACSKLAVTLLVKANEAERLEKARQYREYCVAFFERGAAIERDNARFATALAYRYYSNVHELTRQGERKDSDIEFEISKANEWLSKAIEMNPQSIKNNYRKGKLIIEKQAPYLLFGKKAFGSKEAEILREIRQVGEEHLASAITLYEALEDEQAKKLNRREYAKACFTLGKHYISDAYLPMHEYFVCIIANNEGNVNIEQITKLNIQSASEYLEKCWAAETDLSLSGTLNIKELAGQIKQWTRSPIDKLYQLGCVASAQAFVALAEGKTEQSKKDAENADRLLNAAKRISDMCKDVKRNTWHISEKMAWTHIMRGEYSAAANLLKRAKAGYILNTYAIALMLSGDDEDLGTATAALEAAVQDKNNLAKGLSRVLYAYLKKQSGEKHMITDKNLSGKNSRLADVLGVAYSK